MKTLEEYAYTYNEQALNSNKALEFYASRGFDSDIVKRWSLGWIVEPMSSTHKRYRDKAVIPYVALGGRVISMRVRADFPKAKYMPLADDFPLPEPKSHLFNARHAMPTPLNHNVVITEGEFDAIAVVESGLRAIGVAGVSAFHDAWLSLLDDSGVVLAFDADDPGREGAKKLAGRLAKRGINHRVCDLPDGKDLNDLWREGGRELVREALAV